MASVDPLGMGLLYVRVPLLIRMNLYGLVGGAGALYQRFALYCPQIKVVRRHQASHLVCHARPVRYDRQESRALLARSAKARDSLWREHLFIA